MCKPILVFSLSLSQAEQLIKLKQISFCQPKTHSLTNRSKLLVIGCLDAAEMKYKKIFYTNFGHIFEVPPILTLQGQCLQKWASQNRLFDDLTFLLENPFYSINAIKRTRQHAGEKIPQIGICPAPCVLRQCTVVFA